MTDDFRKAVEAIDTGDIARLTELLTPELVQERANCGTGYFANLYAQVCLDRPFEPAIDPLAFAGAALHGKADALKRLIEAGNNVNAFNPEDFHSHGTALHHATPLGWAEHEHRDEIAAYLRRGPMHIARPPVA